MNKEKIQEKWEKKQEYEIFNPQNLEETFDWMDRNMTGIKDEIIKGEEELVVAIFHHGPGTWLRNNLHLWEDCNKPYKERTPLTRWFNDNGIYHPDDISAVLFTSLIRHLKGEDLKLEEQFKIYKDYWNEINPTVNTGK